jgi:hypothetical protein
MADYPYRTVIDAAPLRTALVDAETVFAELSVTPTSDQTTQMETVIGQASGLIDAFLDRRLAETDVTDHFRRLRCETLRLSRWPVAEILQVIENGTELTPDLWELDEPTGQLWRLSADERTEWLGTGTTTISYIGGYELPDDLPADLQRAAIDQIKFMYFAGDRDPALRSLDIPGVASESYAVAGGSSMGRSGLLISVESALMVYRRMVV